MPIYAGGNKISQFYAPAPQSQLHLNGPEYGVDYTAETGTFSSANPGVYGTDYHYDGPASVNYLASRGWRILKLPIRWERIQADLHGPLRDSELARLTAFIDQCQQAGVTVNLDIHNYGLYYRDVDGVGVRTSIGDPDLPVSAFVDLWRRLATEFKDHPAVSAYNLCAEPQGDYGALTAATWRDASQAAVTAIREVDPRTEIHVGGFAWSNVAYWRDYNPDPWIIDPANNFRYVGHHYWDSGGSGGYEQTYAAEVNAAEQAGHVAADLPTALHTRVLEELTRFSDWLINNNVRGIIGEAGWPHDSSEWNALGDWYLGESTRRGIPFVHWQAGEWGDWDDLALYQGSPIDTARPNAFIAESHFAPLKIRSAFVHDSTDWVRVFVAPLVEELPVVPITTWPQGNLDAALADYGLTRDTVVTLPFALDISGANTLDYLFYNCPLLSTPPVLLGGADHITSAISLFQNCTNLTGPIELQGDNCMNWKYAFASTQSLTDGNVKIYNRNADADTEGMIWNSSLTALPFY